MKNDENNEIEENYTYTSIIDDNCEQKSHDVGLLYCKSNSRSSSR